MDPSQITPNALAWLALLGWPLVVVGFYAAQREKAPPSRTTAWMLLLPLMFLPSNLVFKLPGIPPLDKNRVAMLSVAVALELFHPRPFAHRLRDHWFPRLVLAVILFGIAQTVRTNSDVLVFGPTQVPALTSHDTLSLSIAAVLDLYIPFVVGQRVFRSKRDVRELFVVVSACALIYAPLILFELRFSPQLHRWVYGYHPHEFSQTVRGGGFRPNVFMNHGLGLAMVLVSALVSALALQRAGVRTRPEARLRAWIAGILLVLSKSMGATLYGMLAVALHLVGSSKMLARVAVLAVIVVVGYPAARSLHLVPTRDVIGFFTDISGDRAASLAFRFEQEERLLARAELRPVYGWGSWGRNEIFAPWGQMVSIADGYWVIALGSFGYVGFAGVFALVLVPLVRYARCRGRHGGQGQILLGCLALLLSFHAFDDLINNQMFYLPLAWSGALYAVAGRREVRVRPGPVRGAVASPRLQQPALALAGAPPRGDRG